MKLLGVEISCAFRHFIQPLFKECKANFNLSNNIAKLIYSNKFYNYDKLLSYNNFSMYSS